MKKLTTVALAGAMAVSSIATASMSRWNGFGASNQFIADVQDIWTLPAVVASNPNATYFEFGANAGLANAGAAGYNARPTAPWGGAHMAVGPGVLGIWGNRPYTELSNIDFGGATAPNPAPATGAPAGTGFVGLVPSQQIDLLYGWSLNDKAILGIGLNRAVASRNRTETAATLTTITEASTSDLGVSVGVDLKEVGPINLLEIGLQYNMMSGLALNNNGTVENKNTATGSDIDLRVGGDILGDKGAFSRAEIVLGIDSLSMKTEPAVAPTNLAQNLESKNGGMNWLLGYAMGMSSAKGMGLGGFTLVGTSQTRDESNADGLSVNKYSKGTTSLNFVTAGEAKLKEWLQTRAGLSTTLWGSQSTVTETGPTATVTKTTISNPGTAATALSTGVSLIFGDVTIDGVLNQDFLYTGPFFTNGIATALYSQVSATWAWGGSKE